MVDLKSILLHTSILLVLHNVNGLDPLVETNVGIIKGLKGTDGDYSMFLGIPYAEVNLENPFGLSNPYPPFNATFEAFDDSAKCPQYDTNTQSSTGDLDCLHLNVYVPDSASAMNLLPVMVFIHGGAFTRGYGTRNQSGPKFLVRHDIVLITFTYRVGAYGFMCLGTREVPGNQGLKDQVLALRWIKANIKAFGGDPDQITILGESAGGRSVDFHLMADDENLFNKAVMQSGNSMSPPAVGEVNTELPIALARNLGFVTDDFRQAVSFLTNVDPQLVATVAAEIEWVFQACVEIEMDGVERFVTDFTINRKVPIVQKIPILLGFNNNERYFAHANADESYYKGMDLFGGFLKDYFTFVDEKLIEMEQMVRRFYIGDDILNEDVRQELADFDSDFTYLHPTHRRISHYIANGAEQIYYYMFSYDGERNIVKRSMNLTVAGAVHADELGYLFDIPTLNEPNPDDQLMIDRMTTLWTNFAKYGNPTPETTELLPVKWEKVSEEIFYYYSLDADIELKRRPFYRRMTYWDLFFEINKKLLYGLREEN